MAVPALTGLPFDSPLSVLSVTSEEQQAAWRRCARRLLHQGCGSGLVRASPEFCVLQAHIAARRDFTGTNFSDALMDRAVFVNANFTDVRTPG